MPNQGFSVGRDLSVVLTAPSGAVPSSASGNTVAAGSGTIQINGITSYTAKPMFTDLKHKGLDGNVQHAEIPDGWQITFKADRKDPTLDQYFAALEASYFAGTNITGAQVTETIQEVSGSISQYQYTNVALKYDDAGNWEGDKLISITITGFASRRIKVA